MKKIVVILLSALMLCSCASLKYKNYKPIKDYSRQMEVLKYGFPEVYELYRNGDVVLDEVFEYTDRYGEPKIHISYHYRYGGR